MTRRTTPLQPRLGSAAAALLLLALVAAPALALDEPPRLEGQVTDQAGVLTPAEETEVPRRSSSCATTPTSSCSPPTSTRPAARMSTPSRRTPRTPARSAATMR